MRPAAMAKKRAPKAKTAPQRDALIAIRCQANFKVWLERFAKQERSTPTQMVELGLVALAKDRGFEVPPER